jgi:hypothetical protein
VALASADGRRPRRLVRLRDRLDNKGEPSANRVVPDWQDLEMMAMRGAGTGIASESVKQLPGTRWSSMNRKAQ